MERFKKMLWMVQILPGYLADIIGNSIKHLKDRPKDIFVTLDDEFLFRSDDGFGREAYYLLKSLSDAGYNVFFYRSKGFLSYWRLGFLGRLIYSIDNVKFVSKLPDNPRDFIYAFDDIRPDFLKCAWRRLVYVNIKKPSDCYLGNVVTMPFYMMPFIYAQGLDKHLEAYRHTRRRCRLFFGGSLNPQYYDSPIFRGNYPHLMTRLKGLKTLMESGLEYMFIDTDHQLKQFIHEPGYLNRLIVLATKGHFPVKSPKWLELVAGSDFYMCLSGTDYPMCHNAIEAMAVGTIPVLAYPDWFYPRLEHGKNAIVYDGPVDLINKLKAVRRMPQEQIERLRAGVIEYYERYLKSGLWVKDYEAQAQDITTVMLLPNLVCDERKGQRAGQFLKQFANLCHGGIMDESDSHYSNL